MGEAGDEYAIAIGIIITALVILLLVAGITLSFFMINKEKSSKAIALSKARLSYEKELRIVENELSEHLMQQFGRELHDNIGHLLTCLRLELENRKLDNESLFEEMSTVDQYLDQTTEQLRLLSRSLNTDYVTKNGLVKSITLEIERYRQLKKFDLQWKHDYHNGTMDSNQELMVFRIFQEVMNNAAKHSQAKAIALHLVGNETFELTIQDDGVGFDTKAILSDGRASGLQNILKRADMAGLHCLISAEIGEGTSFHITNSTQKKIN